MKNVFLTAIGIIAFLAAVSMMASCNESMPVACVDNWDDGYDAGVADERAAINAVDENVAVEPAENEFAQIDWKFRAETCEDKFLQLDATCRIIDDQFNGLLDRYDDMRDAMMTLPQETIDYNCGREIWAEWICKMLNDQN